MNADVSSDLAAIAETLRQSTVAVRTRGGGGSGVTWSDGRIVTNAHVVGRAERVEIVLPDERAVAGRVVARAPERDLALVAIDAPTQAPAVRDPATLRAGELVIAVGHPFGVRDAVATGMAYGPVGARSRRFVRAGVRLAPGNSGGPLADARGRVVGINAMVVAGGMALAVPIDEVVHLGGASHAIALELAGAHAAA